MRQSPRPTENVSFSAEWSENETGTKQDAQRIQKQQKQDTEQNAAANHQHNMIADTPCRPVLFPLSKLGFQEDVHARDDIVYKELFELPICCAISDKHPYAQKELLAEEELYSENIVLCNSYPVSSKALSMQKRLEQHFPLNRVYYCDNPNAQITLVTAGYGFAILPQAFTGTAQIRYVPLKNAEIVSYGFFYKNNSANPLLKKFVSMV